MTLQRIFAIRPEPGLSATIAAGANQGIPIIGHALSRVEPRGWTLPNLAGMEGLLIGSGNAIRHAGEKLAALKHLPVLAVGQSTANTAREAGLSVEAVGTGGLQQLLDGLAPKPRHLLRLAGEDHIELVRPAQINLTQRIVYRVQPIAIERDFALMLGAECLVLLHSASAAAHFASECDRMEIDRSRITLAALGPRILEAAGHGWRASEAAPRPSDADLLALAHKLCH